MKLDHFPAELQAWISAATNESNSVNRMLYVNNFGIINKRGLSNESCGTHSKPLNVDTPPDHETISSEPCGTVSKFTNNDTHPDHETIKKKQKYDEAVKRQRRLRTIPHCLGFQSVTGTVMLFHIFLITLPPAERIP